MAGEERQRRGGSAAAQSSRAPRRRRARVSREAATVATRGSRGRGETLYRAGRSHLGVRALARTARRGIGARPDSGRVLIRPELGDDPDRRAPPVGGLQEGEARTGWAGGKGKKITGHRWGFGPREGKRKRREREMGWAGRAKICWAERRKRGREKRKVFFSFCRRLQTNSI